MVQPESRKDLAQEVREDNDKAEQKLRLTKTPMARHTPGPRGPVVPQIAKNPADVVSQAGAQGHADAVEGTKPGAKGSRVAQLDPRMVLQVELLATKKKLADADERMGLWAVQDARRRKQDLDREESELMLEVSRQLGAPAGSNIRLIDKEKGLCQVE